MRAILKTVSETEMNAGILSSMGEMVQGPLKRLGFLLLKIGIEVPVAYAVASGGQWAVVGYVGVPGPILAVPGYAPALKTILFGIAITGGFCWSIPKSKFQASEN